MMVVHAAPNMPDLELFIDEKPIIIQPLQYLNNIYYRKLLSGNRNFKAKIAGNTILDSTINFIDGIAYSIFITGTQAATQMFMYQDNLGNAPTGGQFKMRFLNLTQDVPNLDLSYIADTTIHFDNVAFGEMRDFKIFQSGIYNFALKQPGTQSIIYGSPDDTLDNAKTYTAFANGITTGTGTDSIGVWILANDEFF